MTGRGLVAAALILASLACTSTPTTSNSPSPSATDAQVAAAIPTPRTTPPGTPGPKPSEPTAASASIDIPAESPNAKPTPTPEPAVWRLQGYVVDEDGKPIASACVVIGAKGCQTWSPHTDERGHYFIDIAHGKTVFDFYFEMPGYKTVWWHVQPEGPTEFNVVLAKG